MLGKQRIIIGILVLLVIGAAPVLWKLFAFSDYAKVDPVKILRKKELLANPIGDPRIKFTTKEAYLTAVQQLVYFGITDPEVVGRVLDTRYVISEPNYTSPIMQDALKRDCVNDPYDLSLKRTGGHSYIPSASFWTKNPTYPIYNVQEKIYCSDPPSAPPEIDAMINIPVHNVCINRNDIREAFPNAKDDRVTDGGSALSSLESVTRYEGISLMFETSGGCMNFISIRQADFLGEKAKKIDTQLKECIAKLVTNRYKEIKAVAMRNDSEAYSKLYNAQRKEEGDKCGTFRTRMLEE